MLNHKTVQKLMAQLNLKATVRITQYRYTSRESGIDDKKGRERDCSENKKDEKWVKDVKALKVKEKKVEL